MGGYYVLHVVRVRGLYNYCNLDTVTTVGPILYLRQIRKDDDEGLLMMKRSNAVIIVKQHHPSLSPSTHH